MSQFAIEVKGLDRLIADLGDAAPKVIGGVTMAIGEEVRKVMAAYPKKPDRPIWWTSDKQRRWYFANRYAEGLDFAYKRNSDFWSERLGPSWAVERYGEMGAVVGTRVSYAKWVQSFEHQQFYLEKWTTDKEAVEEVRRSGAVERIVSQVVDREW